jgi:hypothetical protein
VFYIAFSLVFFLHLQLTGLLCLVLATSVYSLPALVHSGASLTSTDQNVLEHSRTSTAIPSVEVEPQTTEHAEKEEVPDKEDMETAEVVVFRPLFRYKQVQAERRRRLEARRRQANVPNPAYYPYWQ